MVRDFYLKVKNLYQLDISIAGYHQENMCDEINEIVWQPVYQSHNLNSTLNHFSHQLRKVFSKHVLIIEKRVKVAKCRYKERINNRNKQIRKA